MSAVSIKEVSHEYCLEYKFDVLVIYLSIPILFNFIPLLHYISEANIFYICLTALVTFQTFIYPLPVQWKPCIS